MQGVYSGLGSSVTFCLNKYEALLPAFVFMPSHLHLLLIVDGGRLGDFMRDFKKYVAQHVMPQLGIAVSQVWQSRYDRVAVYSEKVFRQKLEYIHRNPVKAGLVAKQEDWFWSSAQAYLKEHKCPIPVWTNWTW